VASRERVASALFLDDDTVRRWHALFLEDGLEGLTHIDSGGGASRLSTMQEAALTSWISESLPPSTRQIGAYKWNYLLALRHSHDGCTVPNHASDIILDCTTATGAIKERDCPHSATFCLSLFLRLALNFRRSGKT
jgi:hypothetical protein